jgi:putative transposase
MPWGLKRYYNTGGLHFITWSCYQRQPLLGTAARRDLLLSVLEQMRIRYRFAIVGYVVMPEHVHLLISEPQMRNPSTVVQAVKLGVVRRIVTDQEKPHFSQNAREMGHPQNSREMGPHSSQSSNHIWQRRFYDFNLWSQRKEVEKLKYMHRNPVERGLVMEPDQWRWSSYRAYALQEDGMVRINDWSWWEEKIREKVS